MNNLHRRRMQESPFPPLNDYIRLVSKGDILRVTCATNSGQVWVAYENNGKRIFTRFSCAKGNENMSNEKFFFSVPAKEAFFIQVLSLWNGANALDVYDASMSKSQVQFEDSSYYSSITNSVGMSLIDMSNSKMRNLKLIGYPNTATNSGWYYTSCKNVKVYNCINAKKLLVNGYDQNSEIHGLYTCTNLEEIDICQSKIYDNNEEIISVFDGSNFPNLQKLTLSAHKYLISLDNLPAGLTTLKCNSCTSITSLDNLPSGLTTLNCSNCTSITSLDNLPSGLTTLNCGGTSITSLDNLPSGLTTLNCGGLNLSKADFSNTIIDTISADRLKVQDGIFAPPITLKSFSAVDNKIKQGDFSQCVNLGTFGAYGAQWMIGKLLLPPSIKTLQLGINWGTWKYPMPDLTACTNLTSINCQNCTNIPNLDQQAFIASLPTFTDGSTHTINLKNTGVIAETVAALEAKGWTVQV